MANEMDFTPELTLTPDLNSTQAAAQPPEAPSLTLNPSASAGEGKRRRAAAARTAAGTSRTPPSTPAAARARLGVRSLRSFRRNSPTSRKYRGATARISRNQ